MVFRFVLIAVTALAAIALAPNASAAIEDEIIVIYKPATSIAAHARARTVADVDFAERLTTSRGRVVQVVEVDPDESRASAIARLQAHPAVLSATPNFVVTSFATNDPVWNSLWGLPKIEVEAAWNGRTFDDVVVGVIDDGIDAGHLDLINRLWQNPGEIPGNGIDDDGNGKIDDVIGWNFFNETNNPAHHPGDFHGTHVAGTIGAEVNNGISVAGVARNARLAPLQVFDSTGGASTADVLDAMIYAGEEGFRVANLSLGGIGNPSTFDSHAVILESYPDTLYVAAAGNSGFNNDVTDIWPCRIRADNMLCVAATDRVDGLAVFRNSQNVITGSSNYGAATVHLAAPGLDICSTIPRSYGFTDNVGCTSGTSMASPHVAGAAALVFGLEPTLTGTQVRDVILETGDPVAALTSTTITGRRLNARAALEGVEGDPVNLSVATLSATATTVGSTISATAGTWLGGSIPSGQWRRNGSSIAGATGTSYVVTADDAGALLSYRETVTRNGTTVTATSSDVRVAPHNTVAPTIVRVGDELRLGGEGTWLGTTGSTVTRQWHRNGAAIAGATGTTLPLSTADAGASFDVRVTRAIGAAASTAMSNAIAVPVPTPTSSPNLNQSPAAPSTPVTTPASRVEFPTVKQVTTTARTARTTRRVDLRVSASQANTRATITLRANGKVIGTAKSTLGPTSKVVRVRLNATGRRLVQQGRPVRVLAIVTGKSGTTTATTRSMRFTLR